MVAQPLPAPRERLQLRRRRFTGNGRPERQPEPPVGVRRFKATVVAELGR